MYRPPNLAISSFATAMILLFGLVDFSSAKSLWLCDENNCCDYIPYCSGIDISLNVLNPLSCGDQSSRYYCQLLCGSCSDFLLPPGSQGFCVTGYLSGSTCSPVCQHVCQNSFYMDFMEHSENMKSPVIVESPQNGYVVKSQSAHLTCKASQADKIRFKCNGEWVGDDESQDNQTNSTTLTTSTGFSSFLESVIKINRQEVESYFAKDGFICHCYAYSNYGTDLERFSVSESAKVQIAYLRKHFELEPISDRKGLGETIVLPCLPPEGEPKPEIFWLKNDKGIEPRSDKNLIIAHDGSLIIALARLNDSGSYTCGAKNLIGHRYSQPALITILVDGQWSEWNSWSQTCPQKCLDTFGPSAPLLKQHRRRDCDQPAPSNGGQFCPGDSDQFRNCPAVCPLGGIWSEWSVWSECDAGCQQSRFRSCQSTSTGMPCAGTEKMTKTCTTTNCIYVQNSVSPSIVQNGAVGFNVVVFSGLALVGLIFFVALIFLIGYLLKRKSRFSKQTKRDWSSNGSPTNYEISSELLYAVPDSVQSDQSGLSLLKKSNVGFLSSPNESSQNEYEIVDERINYNRLQSKRSTFSLISDNPLETSSEFDSTGGTLVLGDAELKLYIPYCAIDPEDDCMTIKLSVHDDEPRLKNENSYVISPVIDCTPSNCVFKKPLVLSLPCSTTVAKLGDEKSYKISLYEKTVRGWILSATVGEETLNTQFYIQIDHDYIHILTERLGKFALVCEVENLHKGDRGISKKLRFFTFYTGTLLKCCLLADLKYYANSLLETERRRGSILVGTSVVKLERRDQEITISLKSDRDLLLILEKFASSQLWDLSRSSAIVVQLSLNSLPFFNLTEFDLKLSINSNGCSIGAHSIDLNENISHVTEVDGLQKNESSSYRMSVKIVEMLSLLLDPATTDGNDWRLLAKLLCVDHYPPYFAARSSPTELIIRLWEASRHSSNGFEKLLDIFNIMQRSDCFYALKEFS